MRAGKSATIAAGRETGGSTPAPPPTSELLSGLLAGRGGTERVTLAEISAGLRGRENGLLLLVLALPEMVPMIGFSLVLAIPIFLLSLHILIRGPGPGLPEWLGRRTLRRDQVEKALNRLLPVFRRIERFSRPRWPGLARAGRPQGGVCLLMSVFLGIPFPGINVLAAFAVAGTGLGILQRDGVIVAVSAVFALLALAAAAGVVFGAALIMESLG